MPTDDADVKPIKRTFRINVDADGKFTFSPNTRWAYGRGDLVRFNSDSGPFTMLFLRKDTDERLSPWDTGETELASNQTSPFETKQMTVRIPDKSKFKTVKNPPVEYDYAITLTRKNRNGMMADFTAKRLGAVDC